MPRASINYALAATLLSQGLSYAQAAPQVGAKTPGSLKNGMMRRGVGLRATRANSFVIERAVRVARTVVTAESDKLKGDMAELLQSQVGKLKGIKFSRSLKQAQKFANVIEPLARTAKIVHNWGESGPNGVVLVGEMDGTDRAPIDIPSTDVKLVSTSVEQPSPPREFDL